MTKAVIDNIKNSFIFISSIQFDATRSTYTSSSFNCTDYKKFCLLINKDVGGTPTNLVIQVEVSRDDTNWFALKNDFWADLRYEDGAGNEDDCVMGDCPFNYMRLVVTATGTSAVNTFTLTVDGIFMN